MRTSKSLKLLFVMDPFKKLDLHYDTTLSIMKECRERNYEVFYADSEELALTNDQVLVKAHQTNLSKIGNSNRVTSKWHDCAKFDFIFIRKDPPVDLEYIYMTYMLEYVADRVKIINHPKGIRDANEKIFGLGFKKWMPPSVVTRSKESILKFQSEVKSDVILKPLNRKGGDGILLLPLSSKQKETIISAATHSGKESVIAQKFIKKGLTDGDKRILILDGKILGAFGRVPKKGEYRANLSLGGSSKKVSTTLYP